MLPWDPDPDPLLLRDERGLGVVAGVHGELPRLHVILLHHPAVARQLVPALPLQTWGSSFESSAAEGWVV